jgi:guanylate kinase
VAAAIARRYPVFLSVSATTRPPRPGEVAGASYLFWDRAGFEAAVKRGQMLEWAEYNGHFYGTPRRPVEAALAQGRPALLEIDLAGARQVRAAQPGALGVFLMPPSWDELERRLAGRGTEPPEQRAKRLAVAKAEVAARGEFDAVVVNDSLEQTVAEVAALMGLERAG